MSIEPTYSLQSGLPSVEDMRIELDSMRDILLERDPFPIDAGVMTLMEVATVYFARAKEMEQLIHRGENDRIVPKASKLYHFRTGELRSFIEFAKAMMELGSRRVTGAKFELELLREQV